MVCCHLHESGKAKGQAAAALTGGPATVEAAAAEELLKAGQLTSFYCTLADMITGLSNAILVMHLTSLSAS